MTLPQREPRDVDHNDPAFIADPYPIYRALHEQDPVHHSANYGGYFLVTKYEDVRHVLLDWETYSSGKPGVTSIPMSVERSFPEIPLEIDPPDHRIYRAIVTPWFSRRRARRSISSSVGLRVGWVPLSAEASCSGSTARTIDNP